MPETYFAEKEFLDQLSQFRELMGSKDFWKKSNETRQLAIDGLGHVWLNTRGDDGQKPTDEQIELWSFYYFNTINEYTKRERFMMFNDV